MFQLAALALAGIGTGASIIGSMKANSAQKQIIEGERAVEAQRRKAMELDARRRILEMTRNQQRARAVALTTATAQGAASGTGLQGGYGQISGQTGVNLLGASQNLQIGRNIFDINSQISAGKMDMADAQTWSSIGQGISSLGGQMLANSSAMGRLSQGFGYTPTQDLGPKFGQNYGRLIPPY